MFRTIREPVEYSRESMSQAARVLTLLSKAVVSVSTRLSVAAVLGLAALPLLPQDATSRIAAATPEAAAVPIEVVHAKPVPLTEDAPVDPAFQLAARRSRPKPETKAPEPPPAHKTSAISPAPVQPEAAEKDKKSASAATPEPEKTPTPPPDAKPEAAQAEPPKPQVWSDAEIIAGLRECVKLLAPIAAEVEISQPVRHEVCGTPAPVLLKRIGSGAAKVEVSPPAVLNCAMVASLHAWVEKTLQPTAREALGTSIARLRNASGYVCRARNGHPLGTDRLSEHALANAIDIAGFVTADGRTIDVARSWGPTARDKIAAAQTKGAKTEPTKKDPGKPEPIHARPVNKKISAIAHRLFEEPPGARKQDAKSARKTAAVQRQGKGMSDVSADPKAIPVTGGPERENVKNSAESAFLHRLHKGACGVFGTVLGPEANEAHRDHFHFDLATRRRSALCQ
jgi:hypothetical protein